VNDVTHSIDEKKQLLIKKLQSFSNRDDQLRYIIERGKKLPPLSATHQQERYLVPGCLSRAWLVAELTNKTVHFKADSEAVIVKGMMAMLLDVYNDNPPEDNIRINPDFLAEVGITEHLSMNRRNGLANLFKQIRLYSAAFQAMLLKPN